MKKMLCLLLAIVLSVNLLTEYSYAGKFEEKEYIFEYSIHPGEYEWSLLNHGERVNTLQIPNSILNNISTKSLVDLVVDYPCFFDIFCYDSFDSGFIVLKQYFNGISELVCREDSGYYLLSKYKEYDLKKKIEDSDKIDVLDYSIKMLYVEILLAQNEIYSLLDEDELNELIEIVKYNYDVRTKSNIGFISYSCFFDCLADRQYSGNYTNSRINVFTPNGSSVNFYVVTGTDSPYDDRVYYQRYIEMNYPGAVVVGDSTNRYNCHAYAWANRTDIWIPDPSRYWLDGSYSLVCYNSPSAFGQRVYYPGTGNEHSGIVVRLNGNEIISKWGAMSLVEHSVDNCPYFYIPLLVRFYA